MTGSGLGSGASKLETAISYLLIVGVVASLLLEIIGITIFYHIYGQLAIASDQSVFIQGQNFFSFIYNLLRGNYAASYAIQLMTAGIVILMLTPYVIVIVSVFYFAREKNAKYVAMTLFVLIILTISLATH